MDVSRIEATFTSRKRQWFVMSAGEAPTRLIDFLREKLPHIDASSWPERMAIGGVYVNGLQASEDAELPIPSKIEYYEPKVGLAELSSEFAPFSSCRIVHEDEYLAVVWKPRRLSCMPGKEQQTLNLKSYLTEHYGRPIHMPSRLDMSTQGLVVVSINTESHDLLQRLFEERKVEKKYLALLSGDPEWLFHLVSAPIGADPRHPVLRLANAPDGRPAGTIFRRMPGSDVAVARPITGRTHQIRVHAAFLGHAIAGDNFYGGAAADELHLASYKICFRHPVSGARLSIEIPDDLLPHWIGTAEISRYKSSGLI